MPDRSIVLYLDTASPASSVAAGTGDGTVFAQRTIAQRRTSERLLAAIEEVLGEAGVALGDLDGIAVLQGPGSFTGLRIGMATVMGLHQALGIRAAALPTLPVLALAASAGDAAVLAAVDATRGDWVVQGFRPGSGAPVPVSEPELLAASALGERGPCRLVGFGAGVLADQPWFSGAGVELIEPPPLAAAAARWLDTGDIEWRADRLTAPIYFRPPAVSLPGRWLLPATIPGAKIQES